jgi:tetratricopeptide (TPR) repeat protein
MTREDLLALAREAEPQLTGGARNAWLDRLEAHDEALSAALEEAVERHDRIFGLKLAAALWRYWYLRGRVSRGRWFLDYLLALPSPTRTATEAAALAAAGVLAFKDGDLDVAERRLSGALELFQDLGDDRDLVHVVANLAMVYYGQADYPRARDLYAQVLAIVRRLGDESEAAAPLLNAALTELRLGQVDAARSLLDQRLDLAERTHNLPLRASTLIQLASTDLVRDDTSAAERHATEAAAILERHPDARGEALVYRVLGRIAHNRGEYEAARQAYNVSLHATRVTGDMWEAGQSMYYLALTEHALGHPRKATHLLGQGADLMAAGGDAAAAEKARRTRQQILQASRGGPQASPTG